MLIFMTTVAFSVTTPKTVRDRLDEVAAAARVSRSWLVVTIAEGFLAGLDAASGAGEDPAAVANREIARALDSRPL
jgi:predicted transcriptional regulator